MEIVLAALVGAISSILLALIGQWGARRAGLGVTQDKLIGYLQGTVSTLERKTEEQEEKIKAQDQEIKVLRAEVRDLKETTIQQAELIRRLLTKRRITISNGSQEEISN